MAQRTLPLLYLNLGGEMMYIIDQRLIAQKVVPEKGSKVLNDITSTMFNKKFINEIFAKPRGITKLGLRTMFDRLAHASIMRLNSGSMDKLYDLMIMAVKHQFLMARNPRDLVMLTLNHLDAIQDYVTNPIVRKNIHMTYELLITCYCKMTIGQLQAVRYSLLNFLQDIRVRVSIFIQDDCQHPDGTFKYGAMKKLYSGIDKPGQMIYFDNKGEVMDTVDFIPGISYENPDPDGGVGIHETGHRGTKLGLNMYANSKMNQIPDSAKYYAGRENNDDEALARQLEIPPQAGMKYMENNPVSRYGEFTTLPEGSGAGLKPEDASKKALAKEELNLLAKLIGADAVDVDCKDAFRINLFDPEPEEVLEVAKSKKMAVANDTLKFDMKSGSRKRDGEIDKIIGEMKIDSNDRDRDQDDDLLALMDQAS